MTVRDVPARVDGLPRVGAASGFVPRAPRVAMEQAIAAALNHLGEGVAVIDMASHRLLFVNDALCAILGQDADELMALWSLESLVAREEAEAFTQRLREREDDSAARGTFEVTVTHPSRGRVTLEISARPFDGPVGPRVLAAVIRDVTERRAQEEELRASHDALERRVQERTETLRRAHDEARRAVLARDDFLSMASHELRTPLTPLLLQIQAMLRMFRVGAPKPTEERVVQDLSRIERQVARMVRLVDHMLDISRIGAGRLHVEPCNVDLCSLAREVTARFVADGADVTLDCDGELVGEWDPVRLDQILTNLIGNAIKYGNDKPIAVRVRGDATRAWLEVCDNGVGIGPDDQARIFERFERATDEPKVAGFGLGLWIVREIVEAHGGAVDVTSEAGAGSTFVVELPRSAPSLPA